MQQLRETLCLVCGLCFTFSQTVSACSPWTQRAICTSALKTTTIVPTQGCWATAAMRTQQIASHMCCTQRCVSVSAASHADTAGPHLISAAVFVLFCFFSMQMFQNYFVVCKCGLKNSPCPGACWQWCQQLWWITLPPTALGCVCRSTNVCTPTNTHHHIDHTVCDLFFAFLFIFLCHYASCWVAKKAPSAQIPSWNY